MPTGNYSYKELTANGTTVIKSVPGVLHRIVVNNPGSSWTFQIFDNTSAVAPAIAGGAAAIAVPAAGTLLDYDCNFYTGLTIVLAGTTPGSITVVVG